MASVTQQDTKDNTSVTLDTSKFHCHSMGPVVLLGLPVKTASLPNRPQDKTPPEKSKWSLVRLPITIPLLTTAHIGTTDVCVVQKTLLKLAAHEGRFDLQKQIGKGLF